MDKEKRHNFSHLSNLIMLFTPYLSIISVPLEPDMYTPPHYPPHARTPATLAIPRALAF